MEIKKDGERRMIKKNDGKGAGHVFFHHSKCYSMSSILSCPLKHSAAPC